MHFLHTISHLFYQFGRNKAIKDNIGAIDEIWIWTVLEHRFLHFGNRIMFMHKNSLLKIYAKVSISKTYF